MATSIPLRIGMCLVTKQNRIKMEETHVRID